ncbi:MAG: AmmeMemoRadiSam system radical SAM enzyme [Candidatus Aenigmarchaeota archaeon]|nr:AmmeMemoRadiSam system radical SAM enzyme [Candidatus Aenigmarchaeota archaeon]
MKKAMLWESAENKKVKCKLCSRRCIIGENQVGFCLVRKNVNGILYSLNYGKLIAANPDPIEKKPLFHFLPGSYAFSIASAGCNFRCFFCQNWQISQVYREGLASEIVGEEYTPQQVINLALSYKCKSISYTYTEPTIFFEFAYEVSKLAVKEGLANTFVTNGYMTPEAIKRISKYLHAATVDFKGNGNLEFYRKYSSVPSIQPIFDSLIEMKKRKIFIEITNLVIPKIGDSEEEFKKLVKWIVDNLGEEIPFHILRFFPHYKLSNLEPTPIKKLERLWKIAKESGLKYVYLGNVPGSNKENTYCPECGNLLIKRAGFYSSVVGLNKKGECRKCGAKINIILK